MKAPDPNLQMVRGLLGGCSMTTTMEYIVSIWILPGVR